MAGHTPDPYYRCLFQHVNTPRWLLFQHPVKPAEMQTGGFSNSMLEEGISLGAYPSSPGYLHPQHFTTSPWKFNADNRIRLFIMPCRPVAPDVKSSFFRETPTLQGGAAVPLKACKHMISGYYRPCKKSAVKILGHNPLLHQPCHNPSSCGPPIDLGLLTGPSLLRR